MTVDHEALETLKAEARRRGVSLDRRRFAAVRPEHVDALTLVQ